MRRISLATPAGAASVVALLALAAGGHATAAGDSTIHACANKRNGVLRLVAKCRHSEKAASWNANGP